MPSAKETGRTIMREILGEEYMDRRDSTTNSFNAPLREISETAAFGMLWSRPGLERKTRSLLCLAMLTALNRPHELRIHLKSALNNGATVEEIQEALLHTVAYCGIPATLDAFNVAQEVLSDLGVLNLDE
jgi:4-carboxymuconolactone decarboxylase